MNEGAPQSVFHDHVQQRKPPEPARELHPRDQLRRQQGERRQVRAQRVAQRVRRQ